MSNIKTARTNGKINLLVSFSGGETSAYMGWWIWNNWRETHNIVFVFANTGQEHYETIQFIRNCESNFGIKVHYIEAVVFHGQKKGNSFKEVNTWELSMDGQPFEDVIKKYGIPNSSFNHCSRDLKQVPINKFGKYYFNGEKYLTAIGIRADEMDRMNAHYLKKKEASGLCYPLIKYRPMTKQKINFWWSQQNFRLELKGYQGNCITCWKKSNNKLYQIAKETPLAFNFMYNMEDKYGEFTPESRLKLMHDRGEMPKYPITFFRGNRSAHDILMESKKFDGSVKDDHLENDETESCEVFSNCETQNDIYEPN